MKKERTAMTCWGRRIMSLLFLYFNGRKLHFTFDRMQLIGHAIVFRGVSLYTAQGNTSMEEKEKQNAGNY